MTPSEVYCITMDPGPALLCHSISVSLQEEALQCLLLPAVDCPLSQPSSVSKIHVRKLTPVEIQEKCDKGLCYNCDEKFSLTHRCKNRMMILLGDEEETTLNSLPEDITSL